MTKVQRINSIQEVQDEIKKRLTDNVYFERAKVTVLSENALDIDYMITKSLGTLGICCVVQTPRFEFIGKDDDRHPVWSIPEFQIVITEQPTINRSRAGASTALDAALIAAESLNEIPDIGLVGIQQTDIQGLVTVVVTFSTSVQFGYARQDLPSV